MYFAKWLPVEGKPKVGDTIKDLNTSDGYNSYSMGIIRGMNNKYLSLQWGNRRWSSNRNNYTRSARPHIIVKLCLCSYETNPGDICIDGDTYESFVASEITKWYPGAFKLIGEISPDAKWVKEEEKFTEEQVRIITRKEFSHFDPTVKSSPAQVIYKSKVIIIQILGPCGHFH